MFLEQLALALVYVLIFMNGSLNYTFLLQGLALRYTGSFHYITLPSAGLFVATSC